MTIGAVEVVIGVVKNVLTGKTSTDRRITDVHPDGKRPRIPLHIMHKLGHTMEEEIAIQEDSAGVMLPVEELVAAAVEEVEEGNTTPGENIIHRNREGGNEAEKEETIAVDRENFYYC
jgi:hypothetical protein